MLFFRFRYEFKSQDLWMELKFVLDSFAAPLLDLFEAMICRIPTLINNQKDLGMIFDILTVICKLFYTLNYQVCRFRFKFIIHRYFISYFDILFMLNYALFHMCFFFHVFHMVRFILHVLLFHLYFYSVVFFCIKFFSNLNCRTYLNSLKII